MHIKDCYHILALALSLFLIAMYAHYGVSGTVWVSGSNVLMNLFAVLFDISVVLCVYHLLARGRRHCIWAPTLLALCFCFTCVWYARFFHSYIHLSAFTQTQNLVGLYDSIRAVASWQDVCVCAAACLLAYAGSRFRLDRKSAARVLAQYLSSCLACVAFFFVFCLYSSFRSGVTMAEQMETEVNDYALRRNFFFYIHGYFTGFVFDASHYQRHIALTAGQRGEVERCAHKQPFATVCPHPRRVLFIVVESLVSDVLGLCADGTEITPTLNRLARQGLFYSRMRTQIHDGSSSDGQFIYFTGLLPMSTGLTVVEYGGNAYHGLATAATRRGYDTYLVNPATSDYWRQDVMCASYGIDKQYSIEEYTALCGKRPQGNWLDDEELFDYAFACCQRHKERPFFMTILTATMHFPYDQPFDKAGISPPSEYNALYAHYLQKAHYTDRQLGTFLARLDGAGLLDGAAIVIAADHNAPGIADEACLPFIIVADGVAERTVDDGVGQIDVYPTMLNLMGYRQCEWMGLGQSLLGDSVAAVSYDDLQRISELIIQSDYHSKQR